MITMLPGDLVSYQGDRATTHRTVGVVIQAKKEPLVRIIWTGGLLNVTYFQLVDVRCLTKLA